MKYKVNEIKVSYQEKLATLQSEKISSSQDAAKLIFDHWDKKTIGLHESFKILLLNNSNKVKGIYELSSGGITGTMVDIRLLFAVVLKSISVGIILVHNHPSGNLKPSESDKRLTEKIKKASEYLDVKLLDHLILTPSGDYFSFSDDCLLN